jgi:MFS family permease
MAFQGPFNAGSATSGFYPQAAAYGVPAPEMLDVIGPFGVGLGIGALVWAPLSNMYGRTPVYLGAAIVACLGALGCSLANNIGAYIGARVSSPLLVSCVWKLINCEVICALGCSASMSLGSSAVRDLFFVHGMDLAAAPQAR